MQKIITIIFFFLISPGIFGQEKLSLEKAIEITLAKNFNIKIAKNNTEILENNVTAGSAGLLPRLDLSGSIAYNNNELQEITGTVSQDYSLTNTGLNLSYTLFDGLGGYYNLKSLKLVAESGELQSKIIIEGILVQLINLYYNVAIARDNLELSIELLEISEDRLERQKVKMEFGNSTSLELLNAEVYYNNDSITFMNALKTYEQSKRNLNVIMGRNADSDFEIDAHIEENNKYSYEDLIESAIVRNTSYNLARVELSQSKNDIKYIKSTIYPRLSLSSSYRYNQQVNGLSISMDNPNMTFNTGITLSFNLFDGGKKSTQRQNANISIQNSRFHLDEEKLNLERDLKNALIDYDTYLKVLAAEEDNLRSAELNFKQSQEYYNLGQISSTQFREAQLNLISSKANINAAKYNAKVAEIELLRLGGILIQ